MLESPNVSDGASSRTYPTNPEVHLRPNPGTKSKVDTGGGEYSIVFAADNESGLVPLLALPKSMDSDILILLLYAIQVKQSQARVATAEERVEYSRLERQKKHEKIMELLDEIRAAGDKDDIGAKVGKAFGWVGVALSWIMVAVMCVVSGGAAAAPLIIAAVAITAFMICQQTGAIEKGVEEMDLNDEEAMAFSIGLAAALLVLQIAMAVLSFGVASYSAATSAANVAGTTAQSTSTATQGASTGTQAASTGTQAASTGTQAANAGTQAANTGTQTANTGTQTANTGTQTANIGAKAANTAQRSTRVVDAANRVRSAAQAAQGLSQAGGASADIYTADQNYKANMARADAQEANAEIAKFQELTFEELQRIRKLIEQMQEASMIVVATFADCRDTAMTIRRTV